MLFMDNTVEPYYYQNNFIVTYVFMTGMEFHYPKTQAAHCTSRLPGNQFTGVVHAINHPWKLLRFPGADKNTDYPYK